MGNDIFSQIHAAATAQAPPASGDVFSQIHSETQAKQPITIPGTSGMSKLELTLRAIDPSGLGQIGLAHKAIGEWAADTAEKNRAENQAAIAAGQQPPHSEFVNTFLGMLGSGGKIGGAATSPTNLGIAGGTALANTNPITGIPVDAAIIAHGGYGVVKNAPGAVAGQPEAVQNALMSGAEIAGGVAGGRAMLSKAAAPLGNTMTKPAGTIAPEAYSPQELKAYADANGIDLNAAQATGHNFPRNLQTAGERASVGGTTVKAQIADSQAALADHVEALGAKMSPNTPDVATAGKAIQSNVQDALDTQIAKSDAQYAAVDKAAQGTTVDLAPVKQAAAKILGDSEILQKAGLDPKTATRVLKNIGELDNDASFTDAQKLRSALLDLSRSPELAISNTAQAQLKQVIGATDSAMIEASKATPGLEKAFRAANENYKTIQDDFNSPRSPMNQILSEPDVNKVPQKLTQKGQIGGSPYNAELLDKYGIDKGPVKSVILNDLYGRNFGLQGKTLGGYSDDFLKSVFDKPGELDEVYKTGAIARRLGLNVNPSGTAGATSAIEQVASKGGLLKGAKQTGAAYLTNARWFNRWMMNPPASGGYAKIGAILSGGAAGVGAGQAENEQ
jgi:hypothetical protein